MKKYPREIFSLYLDNQAGPEERRQVEKIIERDPEARRELESLREFSGLIDASAPSLIQPPPGFREKIIHDLRTGGTGSGGGGGGIGKLLHLKASQYLLTGTVLISLVGSLVYMDWKKNQAGDIRKPAGQEELAMELKEVELVHDRPEFQGMFTEFPGENSGVNLDDIQSHSDYTINQPAGISGFSSLEGEVYVSGKGAAGKKAGRFTGKSAGETLTSVEPARVPLGRLETQDSWSLQSIAQAYQAQGVQAAAAPAEILQLAQQYNLNPGLLVAATLMVTEYDLSEISRRLRASLNASFGRPENVRLLSLIGALEGSETWLPRWKRVLQGYLEPAGE
jgi:hypothetical protein